MISFCKKTILIVGASSGIGKKTAILLANEGAHVILIARREDNLKEICEIIGGKATYYIGDISRISDIEGLVKKIVSEQGRLDGLAYVAGISDGDVPLKFLTYERQLDTFQTNYFAFVECVRQVTKRGNYNEGLRIAAVSSVASLRGEKAHIAYSASKAAMDSAIRCMAKELGVKGICINSVAPSMINTDMYRHFLDLYGETSDTSIRATNRQYLGLGETDDVAYALTFLPVKRSKIYNWYYTSC